LQEIGVVPDMADFRQADGLVQKLHGVDVIFHLAAAQHEAGVPDSYFWDINVAGTESILNASIEAGVKRFVYGSTIGVFGSALDGEISEETEPRPENVYETTKLEAENLVIARKDDIEVTVARISETYGPGDGRLIKLFKAIQSGAFFMIGPGKNIHQLIYVDDLTLALRQAATRSEAANQKYVIAGNERLSTREMCAHVASAVSAGLRKVSLPLWPFVSLAWVLEVICRPLGVEPPLHRRRLDFFRKSLFFNTERSERLLDFKPTTGFADGAKMTREWYVEAGMLKE
jgi:nucleoside-diphosphate-sugar epimerase